MKPTKKRKPVSDKQSGKQLPSKEQQNPNLKKDIDKNKNEELETSSGKTELDEKIRNDIEQTEVNPNVQKREPVGEEGQTEEEKQLNKDIRIVNEQEDDIKKNKYNGL